MNCVFGSQLIATQPGATIGYNYFAMQPLFSLPSASVISAQSHQRSLKGSVSFRPSTASGISQWLGKTRPNKAQWRLCSCPMRCSLVALRLSYRPLRSPRLFRAVIPVTGGSRGELYRMRG